MLTTERAVLIRYARDGQPRRASGLRIGGQYVLTADHCADGTDHRVEVGGYSHSADVFVRTEDPDVDLAILEVLELPIVEALGSARVNRTIATDLAGCHALGFPVWKGSPDRPVLAQVSGNIPTAEGADPSALPKVIALMSLKITDPAIREHRVPMGDLDQPQSEWAGMSGAVVVTDDNQVVGVVRSHSLAEGVGSLTLTSLEAISRLPSNRATRFWTALGVSGVGDLPILPTQVDPTTARLERIHDLVRSGVLYREAAIDLQVKVVLLEFDGGTR
jgi:hypothetical protein